MPTQIHATHIYQETYILCIRAAKFLFNPKPDKNHLKVKNYVSKLLMSGFVPGSYCVLCSVPGNPDLFGGWGDKKVDLGKRGTGGDTGRYRRRENCGQDVM